MEVPDWNIVFEDATLPLMVDIGSGESLFTYIGNGVLFSHAMLWELIDSFIVSIIINLCFS